MSSLRLIGYWRATGQADSEYPHPSDWVDWGWDQEERYLVSAYFASGTISRAYMGLSPCRICGRPNGALEYSDGTYVWPEGLSHYIDEHAVRLPSEVVEHAMARTSQLENRAISDEWWRAQPTVHGVAVSSASSSSPQLPAEGRSAVSWRTISHEPGASTDGMYLRKSNPWLHMAEILVEREGSRILEASMRGSLSDGHAEVTWTESHHMTDAEYHDLVERAQEIAEGSS